MGKYFGTDGIRGVANHELDARLAYKAGFAAACVVGENRARKPLFFIGRDTRISGSFLEIAFASGVCAGGGDVVSLGIVPTPAVAYLTVKKGADAGVVISASHNPFEHNGIKIFGGDGYKLTDEQEAEMEHLIDHESKDCKKTGADIGTYGISDFDAAEEYAEYVASKVPSLSGLRILIDCSNGAASITAPKIFGRLGAECTYLYSNTDGVTINAGCGSTHLKTLEQQVAQAKCYDLGVAFDGDADRCLFVDELGCEIDGDKAIALLALHMKQQGKLHGGASVTVMSNLGMRAFLSENGVETSQTAVGDRYVLEDMRARGWNIGGEQSGHIILSDHATTGDGEMTAVFFADMLKHCGKKASGLSDQITLYPQKTINVAVPNSVKKTVKDLPEVRREIERIEGQLEGRGRVLIRPSGTEALVRVMVEAENKQDVERFVREAAETVANAAKSAL